MHLNYYTFKALATEWNDRLAGSRATDIFSQSRNELSIALEGDTEEHTLKISVDPGFRYVFRQPGTGRRRRNVAEIFPDAVGRRIEGVRAADRDRLFYIVLTDGLTIQVQLFGPRPNVFLVSERRVTGAFQHADTWLNRPPPTARPAPEVTTFESFVQRWNPGGTTVATALSRALPLFDKWMAEESAFRADLVDEEPAGLDASRLHVLFDCAQQVRAECGDPAGRIYWRRKRPAAFSIVPLTYLSFTTEESFPSVEEGVNRFVRATLGTQRFDAELEPMERTLHRVTERYTARAERAQEELKGESRSEKYEHWGHLLMAQSADSNKRDDHIEVPDWMSDGRPVRILLDPSLTLIENAEAYYAKARKSRQARKHAENRVQEMERFASVGGELLNELKSIKSLDELKAFQERHADLLEQFSAEAGASQQSTPYRRIPIDGEYEVWVGRNARQNDALTFHHAARHDYWMHARGVPGSHVILKRTDKSKKPPRYILQHAASVAAWFSEARNSSLVPVSVAERKHVRKPKGSPPGLVRVEREEVLLVEPKAPAG